MNAVLKGLLKELEKKPGITREEFLKLCHPFEHKNMTKEYTCPVCNKIIPEERVAFLKELNYADVDIYCVNHAINRPVKGIYSGEVGTSDLILCDQVYNDSVRRKLYNTEDLSEEDDIIEEDNSEINNDNKE